MAKIYGQLERAQVENLTSDPSGGGLSSGRIWLRTDQSKAYLYDGAGKRAIILAGVAQIVNADVSASAAIAGTKISPIFNADILTSGGLILGDNTHIPATFNAVLYANNTPTNTGAAQWGSYFSIIGTADATNAIIGYASEPRTAAGAFTCGVMYGYYFLNSTLGAGSSVTRHAAIYLQEPTLGSASNASITNDPSASGDFFIRDVGTRPSTFGGYVEAKSFQTKANLTTQNVGLKYASNVMTICQADNNDFSSTAPGYVAIPSSNSSNPGKIIALKITANRTLNDAGHGTPQINAMPLGTTTLIAWGRAKPFYLYAANLDDTDGGLEFFISPTPSLGFVSGATTLGYKANAPATSSYTNCIFLTASSPAAYDGKPCQMIGGFTMTKSAADNWTIALNVASGYAQGITPRPHEGSSFSLPFHQMGAAASSFFVSSGTAPSWASLSDITHYIYRVNLNRTVEIMLTTRDAGNCTNGVGGNALSIALPFPYGERAVSTNSIFPVGSYKATGAGTASGVLMGGISNAGALMSLTLPDAATTIKDSNFSNTGDDMDVRFSYII